MQVEKNNFNLLSATASVLYLLLLIPFLQPGYGVEEDSWGLVVNAFEMQQTGVYHASRLPGHPLHEYLLSALYPANAFTYNFVSAIFAAASLFVAAHFFKRAKVQHPLLAAISLSFIPVVFIAGTYTIDYSMSLFFILCTWYFAVCDRYALAGIMLACAVGTRITNLYMIMPLFVYLYVHQSKLKKYVWLAGLSGVLSIVFYTPVFMQYGKNFFDYSDQFPYPNFPKLIYKSTLGVFGLLGFSAIVIFLLNGKKFLLKKNLHILLSISICVLAYLRLPQKSAYLIPLLPFVMMLFSEMLSETKYMLFCLMLMLSGWCLGIALVDNERGSIRKSAHSIEVRGQQIALSALRGNILLDNDKRITKEKYLTEVLSRCDTLKQNTAIISGWWYNMLLVKSYENPVNTNAHFVFYCDEDSLRKLCNKHYRLYFLEEQEVYNDLMFQSTFTEKFAKPFK
jgi:hypothetical protein